MSLSTINVVINSIIADANKKIGESLIERAFIVNSMFDDAYGSCLGGNYTSGMECVAEALKNLDDLLEYADDVMSTADGPAWEYVRDALGSVVMNKAPLQDAIIAEYKLRIKRYVSPTFGDHPKHYVVKERKITVESENNVEFLMSERTGNLVEATLDTLGAGYYWDKKLNRWVLDALINPVVSPYLEKYC